VSLAPKGAFLGVDILSNKHYSNLHESNKRLEGKMNTAKIKEFNASFPREAERMLHHLKSAYYQAAIPGLPKSPEGLITLQWEWPEGSSESEYRYFWIEIDPIVAEKALPLVSELLPQVKAYREFLEYGDGDSRSFGKKIHNMHRRLESIEQLIE